MSFMKAGGNDRAKEWLERYNIKESDLKNKYSSPAFEAYREKLKATVENRKYVDPSPEEMAKRASPYGSRNGSPSVSTYSAGSSTLNASRGGNEYGQMARSSEMYSSGSQRGNSMTSSGGYANSGGYGGNNGNNGYNGGGSSSYGNGNGNYSNSGSSANGHHRSGSSSGSYGGNGDNGQDIHARFAGRNAIGSHDFGGSARSSPGPNGNNGDDELMNALYDGWSRFSTGVKSVASSAAEKVSSGQLTDEVSHLASRVTASQPWNYVASFFSGDEQDGAQSQQRANAGGYGSQTRDPRQSSHQQQSRDNFREDRGDFGSASGRYGSESNDFGRDAPRQQQGSQQGSYSGNGFGSARPDNQSRTVGERQGLRFDSSDPARRPQSNPARSANGWGGSNDDWDDWDNDSRKPKMNPHVTIAEDDVEVDDYKAPAKSLAAPQPTRPAAHAPVHDDIYDFQIGTSSKNTTPAPASAPASTKPTTAGWDDWDDWGRSK